MKFSKQFWRCIDATVFIASLAVILMIWHSADRATANQAPRAATAADHIANISDTSTSSVSTKSSVISAIPEQADPNYPAPAKQLYKVLNDPQRSPVDDARFVQKLQKFDQQLATLDE